MNDRIPNKVTIECTPDAFTVTVFSNEHKIVSERYRMMARGHAKVDGEEAEWWDSLECAPELADRVDDVASLAFSIMSELYDVRDALGAPGAEESAK